MHLLLSLLFVVAGFGEHGERGVPEASPMQIVNEAWQTHGEGWDKVMAIPAPAPVVILETEPGASVHRGMGSGDVEQWRPLVASQFPPEQVDNALCVVNSESGGNTNAKNPTSNARGLFQIMTSIWGPEYGFTYEEFYIPEINTFVAASIWERSGWQPWSPRTRRLCSLG